MNFDTWTRDELETELGRLDAMQGARSTATMRQRNEIWLEIERRPRQRRPATDQPSVYLGNGYYVDADSPAGRDVLRNQRRPIRIEEPARRMRAQLDALKAVAR